MPSASLSLYLHSLLHATMWEITVRRLPLLLPTLKWRELMTDCGRAVVWGWDGEIKGNLRGRTGKLGWLLWHVLGGRWGWWWCLWQGPCTLMQQAILAASIDCCSPTGTPLIQLLHTHGRPWQPVSLQTVYAPSVHLPGQNIAGSAHEDDDRRNGQFGLWLRTLWQGGRIYVSRDTLRPQPRNYITDAWIELVNAGRFTPPPALQKRPVCFSANGTFIPALPPLCRLSARPQQPRTPPSHWCKSSRGRQAGSPEITERLDPFGLLG